MNTIRALDGLRGIAALIVVVGHFSLLVPRFLHGAGKESGHVGVMIFFALSGFLMGHLYLGRPPTRPAIARFLVRRGARVIPLFAVIVLASFAISNLVPDRRFHFYGVGGVERLLENLAMIRGTGILWTVPVEVQFYLMVPLIWLAFGRAPRACLIGLAGATAAIYLRKVLIGIPEELFAARLLVALPYFFAGLAISRLVTPGLGGRIWDGVFLAAAGGMLLLYPGLVPPGWAAGFEHWHNPAALVLVSLLLVATLRSALADRILGSRPLRFLGRVSYGVYLLHLIVIGKLIRFAGPTLHPKAYILFALSLALILVLAYLAHILIERPARDAVNRWFDRRAPRLAKQAS